MFIFYSLSSLFSLLVIFIHRISHGSNTEIKQQTDTYTRKYIENIQGYTTSEWPGTYLLHYCCNYTK